MIAVAPCETHRLLPSAPMTLPSSGLATDGLLDLVSSSVPLVQERSRLSWVRTFQLKSQSDPRVRFHLNRCHPTFVFVLGLFPESALRLQEWQI